MIDRFFIFGGYASIPDAMRVARSCVPGEGNRIWIRTSNGRFSVYREGANVAPMMVAR